MTATQITIAGIEKAFVRGGKRTVAVDNVDLTIEPGEIFFLLGPSGCGKTTLLRMIAGFIEPTKGRILFDSIDVTWAAPNSRQVGMVFQSYALWPHMSVAENVAFGLRVRKVTRKHIREQVERALALVQMAEYRDRRPNELSGGQQQRVALARALVVKPKVLLLDEPLSNLDAKLRQGLRDEIRRVCKSAETTTVYVTHDQKEALAIADRIAVLRAGRVCQVAVPTTLYYEPADPFVAGFVGDINFVYGTAISRDSAGLHVQTSFGRLISTHASGASMTCGQEVLLGFRPECIHAAASSANSAACVVESITFLGEQQVVTLRSGSETLRATTTSSLASSWSQAACFAVNPVDVMCFARGQPVPRETL